MQSRISSETQHELESAANDQSINIHQVTDAACHAFATLDDETRESIFADFCRARFEKDDSALKIDNRWWKRGLRWLLSKFRKTPNTT